MVKIFGSTRKWRIGLNVVRFRRHHETRFYASALINRVAGRVQIAWQTHCDRNLLDRDGNVVGCV